MQKKIIFSWVICRCCSCILGLSIKFKHIAILNLFVLATDNTICGTLITTTKSLNLIEKLNI